MVKLQEQIHISHLTQQSQTNALKELTEASQQRNYDYLLQAVETYDGEDMDKCETWLEHIETACLVSGRDRIELTLGKARDAVIDVLKTMSADATWQDIKDELRRHFSPNKTRVHAARNYTEFRK